jgi:GNAT superfamily N-acetyltransferase
MSDIHEGYVPGTLGRIIQHHETYYDEYWGLDYEFSREVAVELAEFIGRYDEAANRLWLVMDENGKQEIQGALVVDGQQAGNEGARIRWVILAPELHGLGLGRELMDRAMAFCEAESFERVYLWTYEGLDAARHLYEENGFTLVEEDTRHDWGPEITYQKFELNL